MDTSSIANAWVDSYLNALLSTGLSSEYTRSEAEAKPTAKEDADASLVAKYYVNQILSLDEESIKDSWLKVSHASGVHEKDARLQYLSWRVWGIKRKHTMVAQQRVLEAATEVEDSDLSEVRSEEAGGPGPVPEEDIAKIFSAAPQLPRLAVKTAAAPGATADSISEDSEERELFSPETPASPTCGYGAVEQLVVSGDRMPKLYCVLISMHGLVRGEHMELGKDPDTGGQVKYVVELAKALSRHPAVHRVDLLTRLVRDPKVDPSYGVLEEPLTEAEGQLGGAYIARIPCGPVNTYLRKEQLWPYIREFADNALTYVVTTMARLAAAGEACELYDIHGHYADAGEAAALMSYTLGVDMVLTGHSLGRNKLDHLLKSGTMSRAEIEASYAIGRRIEGEERALDAALLVFTSTQQEVKDQWGLYDGYNADLERVVRTRGRRGRHFPIMRVIPPGLDFSNLKISAPPDPWDTANTAGGAGNGALKRAGSRRRSSNASSSWAFLAGASNGPASNGPVSNGPAADDHLAPAGEADMAGGSPTSGSPKGTASPKTPASALTPNSATAAAALDIFAPRVQHEDPPIWRSIFKFLRHPRKPVILAMSRPDAKKNITTLVKAYGSNKALREIANLVLIMGNREIIDSMAPGSVKVMDAVLKLIDAYDLYGSVAYPKKHTQDDISDIYLLPAATRGVFVNIALQEPFGLTLIEAAAHGVPIVATTNGGPVDIVHTLKNGILVDPTDADAVADALLKLLTHPTTWEEYASSGVTNINAYSWTSHCIKCLNAVEEEKVAGTKRTKHSQLRTNFSASLDDFTFVASSGGFSALRQAAGSASFSGPEGNSSSSSEARGALLSPRASTALLGQSFTTDDIDTSSGSEPALPSINSGVGLSAQQEQPGSPNAAAGGLLSPRAGKGQDRMLASSSMPLTGAYGGGGVSSSAFNAAADAAAKQLGMIRDKYVVFVLDSSDTVARLSKLLARKGKALMGLAAAGHSVGLGVTTAFSLQETQDLLKSAGLAMSDLDFAITNAGSEIWYCGASTGDASTSSGSDGCSIDEQYDHMLDAKWDLVSVRRVLAQCLAERNFLTGGTAAAGGVRPRIRVDASSGTHHLSVTLRPGSDGGAAADAPAGPATPAAAAAAPAAKGGLAMTAAEQVALIGRIKRRFRCSGLRTQVVSQLDGGDIKLHITPLRGSRALALRHLTYKHKVDMTSLVMVCCARDMAPGAQGGTGAAGVARFACSDMEDVVAGVQGVLVVPPPAGATGEGFPVDLGLFSHDGRVQLLQIK
uniref:sucrose-phosphate synthase n=1 Tax=Tetradesmus obliquus TaxID=3088 RepID=A0A383W8H5_TETOB|eukprot:jgi/Sobl393_1/18488/SZX73945.1